MHGSLLGPILGAFSLGMFFPWVNDLGAQLGIFCSILLTGFIGLGNIVISTMDKIPDQKLFLTTEGCERENMTTQYYQHIEHDLSKISFDWKDEEASFWVQLWSISYIWQPAVGIITTMFFGGFFSAIVNSKRSAKTKSNRVKSDLLCKPILNVWLKCFGMNYMMNWVDFENQTRRKSNKSEHERGI